jgi:hypothetical protein
MQTSSSLISLIFLAYVFFNVSFTDVHLALAILHHI